jgi:hypothetical protein
MESPSIPQRFYEQQAFSQEVRFRVRVRVRRKFEVSSRVKVSVSVFSKPKPDPDPNLFHGSMTKISSVVL